MRSRIAVVGALVMSLTLTSSVALASTTDVPPDEVDVILDGAGVLKAHGRGKVVVNGAGWLKINMRGRLRIVDHAGDATITIRYKGQGGGDDPEQSEVDAGGLLLTGFNGVVTVRGSDFTIKARGGIKRLAAVGEGTVFMMGRGWWRAKGVGGGHWSKQGMRISYTLTG